MYAWGRREGRQKFRLFAYVIIPNQERVVKKLAKLEAATWSAP